MNDGFEKKGWRGGIKKPQRATGCIRRRQTITVSGCGLRTRWRALTPSYLGRGAEEKLHGGPAESAHHLIEFSPGRIPVPSQSLKIVSQFLPSVRDRCIGYETQIVEAAQHPMRTPKPPHHHAQPAQHKPRGHQTVRVHLNRCAIESPPACPPTPKPQQQRPHHGAYRVLHIRNQMDRQQGKCPPATSTHKPGNGNPFLLKPRKQLNGISPIGGDLSMAVFLSADGAGRPDRREKINPPGYKRFSVFPDALKCVKVGQLYGSAALVSRGQALGSETVWPASLVRVVISSRSIPYLALLPAFISPVTIPCKYPSIHRTYSVVNNTTEFRPLTSDFRPLISAI